MKPTLARTLQEIGDSIQRGDGKSAASRLKEIFLRRIPRNQVAEVASLARRAGLIQISLRILNPIVRPSGRKRLEASDVERVQYAAALNAVGAGEEALDILRTIDKKRVPDALLFKAFALISQWNYEAAIPVLQQYALMSGPSHYQKLVAKVNLAAALVYERQHQAASDLLKEILEISERDNLHLLRGNALELAAQNAILHQKWSEAKLFLECSEKLLANTTGLSGLFVVQKWKVFLEILSSPPGTSNLRLLESIRKEGTQREQWEIIRACDNLEAIREKNRELFTHLFFGTPFESFRKRLVTDFGKDVEVPDQYDWRIAGKPKPTQTFDLVSCEFGGRRVSLKAGQTLHLLLLAFAADFYRPQRLAGLHFRIYPNEYYNSISSHNRVHTVIARLRHWFDTEKIPLAISEISGQYRLEASEPIALRVYRKLETTHTKHSLWAAKLKSQLTKETFSIQDVLGKMDLPYRTAIRLLTGACEEGLILRFGTGRATSYRFL